MNKDFAAAMRRAALSTRASDLAGATRIIQDALAGKPVAGAARPTPHEIRPRVITPDDITPPPPRRRPEPRLIDPDAEIVEPALEPQPRFTQGDRLRKPLGEVLATLRAGRLNTGFTLPGMKQSAPPPIPDGARYLTRSFACAAGARDYKLYVPASAPVRPKGLVIMLHGCKQDPDDFASGTGMNAAAEAHGLLVAWPEQTRAANASSCWNWFSPGDQMRDAGEPSILAGITREIMSEFEIDGSRVFVAGLSAGGAMAVVMGETYPDLFAAVGVHSGLPYGCANDVMSAFAAMRGDSGLARRSKPRAASVRTIVFQGSADGTVHRSNAARIVAAAASPREAQPRQQTGRAAGGRSYTRTIVDGADGVPAIEAWMIDGAGHAWSGGQPKGSYTDPAGPNASAEMLRFFLAKPPIEDGV